MPRFAFTRAIRFSQRIRRARKGRLVFAPYSEGRYYFDRQETSPTSSEPRRESTPKSNRCFDRETIEEMFAPTRKTVYDDVLPLPKLEDVADRVRKGRVLLIVSPDSKIPPRKCKSSLMD